MDARIAAQLSGVGHPTPTRSNDPGPGAAKRAANADGTAPVAAAVFDANGDGAIETWSYAHGGDSYKTFKPPPSGAAGSNLRRVSHAPPVPSPPAAHAARSANAHVSTAAMHHAHAAYQRDGGATAPDARPAAPATAVRAPDAASAPVTDVTPPPVARSAAAAALPSSGS
jgi:hypothetical protein